jgi:hypothetical protein
MEETKNENSGADVGRAFDVLLKGREIDLNLFSARSNLCVVLQGGLFALISRPLLELKAGTGLADKVIPLLLVVVGAMLSYFAVRVVRGGSFWVNYWEFRLEEIEGRVLHAREIFRNHPSSDNPDCRGQLPKTLKHISSKNAVIFLFRFIELLWALIFVFVLLR